jgi:hypothetical protein
MNVKPNTQDAKPVPNKFFEANGKVTDAGGKDWDSAWGHMLSS